MAEAALRRMSVDELVAWEAGDDRRYELVAGVPLAIGVALTLDEIYGNLLSRDAH